MRQKSRGLSILEVQMAMMVLLLGVLAVSGLGGMSMENSDAGLNRSIASNCARFLLEQTQALSWNMQVNLPGTLPSSSSGTPCQPPGAPPNTLAIDTTCNGGGVLVDGASGLQYDILVWNGDLPDVHNIQVDVYWMEGHSNTNKPLWKQYTLVGTALRPYE